MVLLAAALFLLSPEDAARIRRLPAAEREPLRLAAELALKQGPWSVTYHRPKGPTKAGPHDFFSEGPYWWPNPKGPDLPYVRRDGEVNPNRFVDNDRDLAAMSEAVMTLGMAAAFFDDERYARRAAELIRVWFVDPKTRMNPNLEFGQAIRNVNDGRGIGIIDTRPLIWCAQGIGLARLRPGWDRTLDEPLREWFQSYVTWLTTSRKGLDEKRNGNNHSTWWAAQVAAFASLTGDRKTLEDVWTLYREYLVPHQLRSNGSAPEEEARTRSLSYSVMNLEGFAILCRIAQGHGVDLWRFEPAGYGSVKAAVEYLRPYLADPSQWKKPQISKFDPARSYFLGLAGLGLGRAEYLTEQRKLTAVGGAWGILLRLLLTTP